MTRLSMVFKVLLIITLPIVILLTSVEIATFNLDYFDKKYEEYNITEVTGMEKKTLMKVTDELLKYLKGDRENILIRANIKGEDTQVFKEREMLHLKDVQVLFIRGFYIRNISLIIILISLIYLAIYNKRSLSKVFIISSIYPVILIGLLGVLMKLNFYKYFTYFHEVLFTNDLWLLDPKTEVLIQMYPLDFFNSIAFRIVGYYLLGLSIVLFIGLILRFTKKINS